MNWAAITYALLFAVGTAVAISKHGKPRDPYNGFESLAAFILSLFLLWQAGLFE